MNASMLQVLNAYRAVTLHQHSQRVGFHRYLQAGAFARWPEVGNGSAASTSVTDRHLQRAESVLIARVVIFGPSMAGSAGGLCIGLDERVLVTATLDSERTVAPPHATS